MTGAESEFTPVEHKNMVYMSDEEAQDFLAYMRHRDSIDVIVKSGVFGIRNGQATLEFNNEGVLVGIETKVRTYRRTIDKKAIGGV